MAKPLDLAVEIELEKRCDTCAELLGDLGLPDIQGYQLLPMIRGRNDEIPIIVLSSRGGPSHRSDSANRRADAIPCVFAVHAVDPGSIFRGRPRVPK